MQLNATAWRRAGAAGLLAAATSVAWANDPGWYTGLGLGIGLPGDAQVSARNNASVSPSTGTFNYTQSFDAGVALQSRIGYDFDGALRPEASLGLLLSEVSSDGVQGDLQTTSLFANLWFDLASTDAFGRLERINPYVGFGAGMLQYTLEDYAVGSNPRFSESDTVGAFQIGTGFHIPYTDQVSFSVDYRYLTTADPDLSANGAGFETEHDAHSVFAGVSVLLGQGARDSDRDGVTDNADACPGTPVNVEVGSSGCPFDSDNDGVVDYIDSCPGTLAGATVDERGCAFDSDRDGVADSNDRCPSTTAGVPVDRFGCELDSDGDGVPDGRDRCANTPSGTAVNAAGCRADSDGDGVTDALDQCDNTPRGVPVMSNGCGADQSLVLEGVNFELNSAKLAPNATRILDAVARTMLESPNFSIQINGHTDSQGSAAYNRKLSQQRASSVRDYLISAGVDAGRLKATGLGESSPIASNDTADGRAQNRRVEIRVLR